MKTIVTSHSSTKLLPINSDCIVHYWQSSMQRITLMALFFKGNAKDESDPVTMRSFAHCYSMMKFQELGEI